MYRIQSVIIFSLFLRHFHLFTSLICFQISSSFQLTNYTTQQQRNFKQKIVALLKRFRPEELENEVARRQGGVQGGVERDLDALFHELESLSCGEESGQDIDSISIGSTPKPSLRPFFNSKYDNGE